MLNRGILLSVFAALACSLSAPTVARGQNACIGIGAEERDTSLFQERELLRYDEVTRREGKQMIRKTKGGALHLAPRHGDSAVWIQRAVQCQAALGTLLTGEDSAALTGQARVDVRESGDRFVVRVTSDDQKVARELADRMSELVTAPRSATP